MVTREVIAYIQGEMSRGTGPDTIRATLASQGWTGSDIDQAFLEVGISKPSQAQDGIPQSQASSLPESKKKNTNIFDFRNFKWYEWIAMLPAFILVIQGGALGGVAGFLGWAAALKLIRNPSATRAKKIAGTAGIIFLSYLGYFIGAIIFSVAIRFIFGVPEDANK